MHYQKREKTQICNDLFLLMVFVRLPCSETGVGFCLVRYCTNPVRCGEGCDGYPPSMGQYRWGRPVRERCTLGMPVENLIGEKSSFQVNMGNLPQRQRRCFGGESVVRRLRFLLAGVILVILFLHFTPILPIITYGTRMLSDAVGWDLFDLFHAAVFGLIILAAILYYTIPFPIQSGVDTPKSTSQRLAGNTLLLAVVIVVTSLAIAVSNSLKRDSITRTFDSDDIEANYKSWGTWEITLKNFGTLTRRLDQVATLSKIDGVGSLTISGEGNESLPNSLGSIYGLDSLTISSDSLKQLPDSLGHITRLRMLSLYLPKLRRLPNTMVQLDRMESLSLNKMESLSGFPEGMNRLSSLKNLTLSDITMDAIPESLGSLQSLESLFIRSKSSYMRSAIALR